MLRDNINLIIMTRIGSSSCHNSQTGFSLQNNHNYTVTKDLDTKIVIVPLICHSPERKKDFSCKYIIFDNSVWLGEMKVKASDLSTMQDGKHLVPRNTCTQEI